MSSHEIARVLGCSERLVFQYLEIDQMLEQGES
jgi:DNA-binding CsgD family transcriptional regulator